MANEAVLMYETSLPLPMTVSNGTGIEKGAVLTLTDPFTASLLTVSASAVAGIAAEEKIASDGKTTLGVYRSGIFKMTASGSVTVGTAVVAMGSNKVGTTAINDEFLLGLALETATDGETLLVELRPVHIDVK